MGWEFLFLYVRLVLFGAGLSWSMATSLTVLVATNCSPSLISGVMTTEEPGDALAVAASDSQVDVGLSPSWFSPIFFLGGRPRFLPVDGRGFTGATTVMVGATGSSSIGFPSASFCPNRFFAKACMRNFLRFFVSLFVGLELINMIIWRTKISYFRNDKDCLKLNTREMVSSHSQVPAKQFGKTLQTLPSLPWFLVGHYTMYEKQIDIQ